MTFLLLFALFAIALFRGMNIQGRLTTDIAIFVPAIIALAALAYAVT